MKKPVNESSDFEKRLLEYSAMAGAVLILAPSANGTVHRTVVNQYNIKTYNFDVNNDATIDFWLAQSTSIGYDFYLSLWKGRGVKAATAGYCAVMSSGSTIGPSRSFTTGSLVRGTKGPWGGQSNKFLGVRIDLDSSPGWEYHYVWVKLSVNTTNYRFDLLEYAWEDVEDLPIVAGSDVSLPVELSSFSAVLLNGGVTLSWTTECEVGNLGFILERQAAGESTWLKIASYETHAELSGKGTTSSRTEYSFTDMNVIAGQTYKYRLSDVDLKGNVEIKDMLDIFVDASIIPGETAIEPVYPNPFNPDTKIYYKLAENGDVSLRVIDLMGRTVNTLVENVFQPAGSYVEYWNGKNTDGQPAASGVYFLVLQAGTVLKTQKVMLVR